VDDTERLCCKHIEEGKHSQVFGLHTDAVARLPVPKVNSRAPVVFLGLLLAFGILGSGFQGFLTGLGGVLHVIFPTPTLSIPWLVAPSSCCGRCSRSVGSSGS